MPNHRDDTGQMCTRHVAIPTERMFELATLGSRVSGFHHDSASKLQSLVMAIDELGEYAEANAPEIKAAAETARTALTELNALFTANRALAKGPQRSRIPYADILARAADRVGVKLVGDMPACEVRVTVPAVTHALALLIDLCAAGTHAKRVVEIGKSVAGHRIKLELRVSADAQAKQPPHASEAVAIAAFVIARDEGDFRCGSAGDRFVTDFAIATPTAVMAAIPRPT